MEKLFYDSSVSDNGYEVKERYENAADQNNVKDGMMFKDINNNEYQSDIVSLFFLPEYEYVIHFLQIESSLYLYSLYGIW